MFPISCLQTVCNKALSLQEEMTEKLSLGKARAFSDHLKSTIKAYGVPRNVLVDVSNDSSHQYYHGANVLLLAVPFAVNARLGNTRNIPTPHESTR